MNSENIYRIHDLNEWKACIENFSLRHSRKKDELSAYIEILSSKRFEAIATSISQGSYHFSAPKKYAIGKHKTSKKRIIYVHNDENRLVLRLINRLVNHGSAPITCFSFVPNGGAKLAFQHIHKDSLLQEKACIKTDIRDYFNSIPIAPLLEMLSNRIAQSHPLYQLSEDLLTNRTLLVNNIEISAPELGVMAGNPLAPFLSNLYLSDIDEQFTKAGYTYARYSDDIILFSNADEAQQTFEMLEKAIHQKGLQLNSEKTKILSPGTSWDFLGFCHSHSRVGLSVCTKNKLRAKVHRLARKFRSRVEAGRYTEDKALEVLIRILNRKLFGSPDALHRFNWSVWFFPVLTDTSDLKALDCYIQERLRFVCTGKNNKVNYKKVPYSSLKKAGYRSLVNEYYQFINVSRNPAQFNTNSR